MKICHILKSFQFSHSLSPIEIFFWNLAFCDVGEICDILYVIWKGCSDISEELAGVGEKFMLTKNLYVGENTQHTISYIYTNILFYQLNFHQYHGALGAACWWKFFSNIQVFRQQMFPTNNRGTYPWSQNDHLDAIISYLANGIFYNEQSWVYLFWTFEMEHWTTHVSWSKCIEHLESKILSENIQNQTKKLIIKVSLKY